MTTERREPRTPALYDSAGVTAASRFVRAAASTDAAAVFAVLAEAARKQPEKASLDIASIVCAAKPYERAALAPLRLHAADQIFGAVFGFRLLAEGSVEREPGSAGPSISRKAKTSKELVGLFERPPATAAEPSAIFDEAGMNWVSIANAAARSRRGHHLTLRCAEGDRTAADFASLLSACGSTVFVVGRDEQLRGAILRAELHGGGEAVVVVDGELLVVGADEAVDEEQWQATPRPNGNLLMLAAGTSAIIPRLKELGNTYVWRIPGRGAIPAELNGLIGGCMGPLSYDAAWSAAYLKARAKGIGPAGTRALLGVFDDARDAEAIAALATTIATAAVPGAPKMDEACKFLAASFKAMAPMHASDASEAAPFDERLIACGADGIALLSRGEALARRGRVLAVGPPGGGKSAYAKALGARISSASGKAEAGMLLLEPADILAKSWGATEKLLAALWMRASREGATIVADELDSLCAVRETGVPASGNAYLIRCLTNEVLRQLDAFPSVPVIATVNDVTAVDPAVRRRFTVVIEVKDELDAGQERLAWEVILKMKPPDGWSPCRAAIADFTSAAKRCSLLGRDDAETHAAAIIEARQARQGPRAPAGRARRSGALH